MSEILPNEGNTKDAYISLMELLLGTDIDASEPASKYDRELQSSCSFFNEAVSDDSSNASKKVFSVGLNKDYPGKFLEPCPIFYTGGLKEPFRVVFIGLNPHREPPYLSANTTWQYLSNYHCTTSESIMVESNYKRIADTLLKYNEYFDPVFRIHQLLCHKTTYNRWTDIQDIISKEYFLKEINKFPIANIELIPYKSEKYSLNSEKAKKIERDEKYIRYLDFVFNFIDENTNNDSWIIFLGDTPKVKRILYGFKNKKNSICPADVNKEFTQYEHAEKNSNKKGSYNNKFYGFKWGGSPNGKKVFMSPFIYSQRGEIPLKSFSSALHYFFGEI